MQSRPSAPLQTLSEVESSLDYDRLRQDINYPISDSVVRRFSFLHTKLNLSFHAESDYTSIATVPEENIGNEEHTSIYTSLYIRNKLLIDIKEKLSGFDKFLLLQNYIVVEASKLEGLDNTLSDWLFFTGPSFCDNFNDPDWASYARAVKRLLLDPESKQWLSQNLEIFLDGEEQLGQLSGQRHNTTAILREDIFQRAVRRVFDIEQGRSRQNRDLSTRQSISMFRRVQIWGHDKLFTPVAFLVCALNITSALGYVMLMNDVDQPKSSYIIASLTLWSLTSGMMICHGLCVTHSKKDYARHLVIVGIFTCFVVANVFHCTGASNFSSSFLVGVTIAILLIEIW